MADLTMTVAAGQVVDGAPIELAIDQPKAMLFKPD